MFSSVDPAIRNFFSSISPQQQNVYNQAVANVQPQAPTPQQTYQQQPQPQPQVIQGAGDWSGYVGPGAANLSNPARLSAMAESGNLNIALLQNPVVNDAIREIIKQYNAYTMPAIPAGAANMPLSQIERQFGPKAAEATQAYYTQNPSQRALDIAQQYGQNKYVIVGSGISTPQSVLTGFIENPRSAAEIAYNVAITGGIQNPFLAGRAVSEGFRPEWLGQVAPLEQRQITPSTTARQPSDILAGIVGGGLATPLPQQASAPTSQNIFSGFGDWLSGLIIPRASAAEGGASSQIIRPTGGLDIGSPYIETPPTSLPINIPTTPAAVLGPAFPGPVRSEQEAIGLNQIYRAAEFNVLGRAGYTPNAPVGSQQWAENLVEFSSAYHNLAEKTGVQQPANPFEYTGDLSLSYLKGTNRGSASSTYGENITDTSVLNLPGGLGVQDVAWQRAKEGLGGNQPNIPPGYEIAVRAIEASKGQYGPYAILYGGGMYGNAASQQPAIPTAASQGLSITGVGIPASAIPASAAVQGGFDIGGWIKGANEAVGGWLGLRANAAEQPAGTASPFVQGPTTVIQGPTTITKTSGYTAPAKAGLDIGSPLIAGPEPRTYEIKSQGDIFGIKIPGISEAIAYFTPPKEFTVSGKTTTVPEVTTLTGREIVQTPTGYQINEKYLTTGGTSTTTTVAEAPGLSGFDKWQRGISEQIYGGIGNILGVKPEAVKLGLTTTDIVNRELANTMPSPTTLAMTTGTSNIKAAIDKPAEAAFWTGVGFATGGAYRGLEAGAGALTARIGTETAGARALAMGFQYAPLVMGGIYGFDVAGRSTEGFTNFGAGTIASRGSVIALQEAGPMGIGAMAGYRIPEGIAYVNELGAAGAPHRTPEWYRGNEEAVLGPGGRKDYAFIEKPEDIRLSEPVNLFVPKTEARIRSIDITGLTEPGGAALPMEFLPGVRSTMTGAEVNPFARTSALGKSPATFAEERAVAEFARGYGEGISGQPISPRTSLFWEKQSVVPLEPVRTSTGEMPWDLLPKTGTDIGLNRMATPNPFAGVAEEMGLRIEYPTRGIGRATEGGIAYGEGTGISQRALTQVVNPEIRAGTSREGLTTDINKVISDMEMGARVRPAVSMAAQQQIIPSATEGTFSSRAEIVPKTFEDTLLGIIEGEKRPASNKLPSGMQIDYLRDAMAGRKEVVTVGQEYQPTRQILEFGQISGQQIGSRKISVSATTANQSLKNIQSNIGAEITKPDISQRQRKFMGLPQMQAPKIAQRESESLLTTPIVTTRQGSFQITEAGTKESRNTLFTIGLFGGGIFSPRDYTRTEQRTTPEIRQTPYYYQWTREFPPEPPITPKVGSPVAWFGGGAPNEGRRKGYFRFRETILGINYNRVNPRTGFGATLPSLKSGKGQGVNFGNVAAAITGRKTAGRRKKK